MSKITINDSACDRSPYCPAARVCPKGALVPIPGGAYLGANGYTIDAERCSWCGACLRACGMGAIEISE